jgi:hypothetical protein
MGMTKSTYYPSVAWTYFKLTDAHMMLWWQSGVLGVWYVMASASLISCIYLMEQYTWPGWVKSAICIAITSYVSKCTSSTRRLTFFRHATWSLYYFPQNAIYFIMLCFSVQIILIFFINHALKCKYQPSHWKVNCYSYRVYIYSVFAKHSTAKHHSMVSTESKTDNT